MGILLFILILFLAALFAKGLEKMVKVENKAFKDALFFLLLGLFSVGFYFNVNQELQFFISTLIVVGFVLSGFYLIAGLIEKKRV